MDKESRKPKTFVSTFRLEIKFPSSGFNAGKKKEEEAEKEGKERRTLMGNNRVEATSEATGRAQEEERKSLSMLVFEIRHGQTMTRGPYAAC